MLIIDVSLEMNSIDFGVYLLSILMTVIKIYLRFKLYPTLNECDIMYKYIHDHLHFNLTFLKFCVLSSWEITTICMFYNCLTCHIHSLKGGKVLYE